MKQIHSNERMFTLSPSELYLHITSLWQPNLDGFSLYQLILCEI